MLIFSLILVQVVVFVFLSFLLKRILTQNVTSATQHLDAMAQEYARKEEEINRRLAESKQESQAIIIKANEEADKAKTEIIKEAEKRKEEMLSQARKEADEIMQRADKSRQMLLAELDERVAKESVDKACQLIQETLPEQFKLKVHQYWIENLLQNGFGAVERLKLPEGANEVKVASAFPLDDEKRAFLSKRLEDIFSRKLTIKEEVDEKLVAGIIITIGSLVLDGTLKNKIQERARQV